ncbi:MAG: hypothetical protein H0X39_15665 [Actinobacteria bacterium]|nr:hypothetical protein [Actinomycetota bacterium]
MDLYGAARLGVLPHDYNDRTGRRENRGELDLVRGPTSTPRGWILGGVIGAAILGVAAPAAAAPRNAFSCQGKDHKYSRTEIKTCVIPSIFRPHLLAADAVRVFTCESGLEARQLSYNTNGTVDRGVSQINSVHDGDFSPARALHPVFNVQYAYRLWHSSGWAPWVCARIVGVS